MEILIHALGQFAALVLVLGACRGFGIRLLRFAPVDAALPAELNAPLSITVGLGVSICALQGLAIAGLLRVSAVLALVSAGLLLSGSDMVRHRRNRFFPNPLRSWRAFPFSEKCASGALALALLSTVLAPLAPPLAWDELMYHLPHAQQWAASGRLQVTEWLRYPWFPYNYNLLYAAALLFGNDVLPHLLHAAAGWLTAWLIYRLGVQYLDRVTACLAALLWILLSKNEYARAYVDMGVTVFVLAACIAFHQWRTTQTRLWLALSAFCLGVAVGSKYQALTLVPFFAFALAWRDRRPFTWLIAVLSLAAPCAYWYARNAVVTGDPFNPFGAHLFGFTDWNQSDYRLQFDDLHRNAGWPHPVLWASLLTPWIPRLRRTIAISGAMALCAWMLVVWVATSRYPRYLMPAYPLLVLLSAAGWMHLLRLLCAHQETERLVRAKRGIGYLLLVCVGCAMLASTAKSARRIAASATARDVLLSARIPGYEIWRYLREHPAGKIYQMGLEDSLYYAPQPVWGEIFGPWRYGDFIELAPQELHRKLAGSGFEALVVHTQRMPHITSRPGFEGWFVPIQTKGPVRLYRLLPTGQVSTARTPEAHGH